MNTNDKIRKRVSYQKFNVIMKAFAKSPKEGLLAFHNELDRRSAYGSNKASEYAKESLDLFIQDNENISTNPIDTIISKIQANTLDAWEDDLEVTKETVILEDFDKGVDEENITAYNGWFEDLLALKNNDK